MVRVTGICLLALLSFSVGCQGRRGATDYLQARLRLQEQHLTEMEGTLRQAERELLLARREVDTLRTQLVENRGPLLPAEQTGALLRVSAIKINSLLTSGLNRDGEAGDDQLIVHFLPVDEDGEVVKLPGNVTITVLDPALPESSRTVGEWTFTAEQCRQRWVRGLTGAGYQFTLEWQEPPQHSELVVQVKLETPDRREFLTTHITHITPPAVDIAIRQERTVPRPDMDLDDTPNVTPATADEDSGDYKVLVEKPALPAPPAAREPIRKPGLLESHRWTDDTFPYRR